MMYNLVKFLQLPVANQERQMDEWLSTILSASEEEQQKGIRNLILATAQLKLDDQRKVVRARTEAMVRLSLEQAKSIIRSRYRAMQEYQAENDMDRRLVMEAVQKMPPEAQKKVAQIVAEIRDEVAARTA